MGEKLIAVPESLLIAIGDAIRAKRNISNPIPVPDMPIQIGFLNNIMVEEFIHDERWDTLSNGGNAYNFYSTYVKKHNGLIIVEIINNTIKIGNYARFMVIIDTGSSCIRVSYRGDNLNVNNSSGTSTDFFIGEGSIIRVIYTDFIKF
ncbi:MAG: hypothetical protein KBT27_06645 [Prevotellaceae bacterium]|nr:hypothetical protein [Candidatus Faecinaster equi]